MRQEFLQRNSWVIFVAVIQIDVIGLQTVKGFFAGGEMFFADNPGRHPSLQPWLRSPSLTISAGFHPIADHRFRLSADMAFNPLVIHICGVDEVAAMAFDRHPSRGGFQPLVAFPPKILLPRQ